MTIRLLNDFLNPRRRSPPRPRAWIEPTGKTLRYEGQIDQSRADALAVRAWLADVEAGRIGWGPII